MQSTTSFLLGLSLPCLLGAFLAPGSVTDTNTAFSARFDAVGPNTENLKYGSRRATDGLFYVQALSGQNRFKFLVDTGATHVVLSHSDASRLTLSKVKDADSQYVETVSGSAKVDWVVIKEIEIEGRILKSLRAAVPHNDVAVSLLGQNALAQFQSLRISGDELHFVK